MKMTHQINSQLSSDQSAKSLKNDNPTNNNKDTNQGVKCALGEKSIFYDQDWNPEGLAPPGQRNIPYSPLTFQRKFNCAPHLDGLSNIPPP